ncbi:MAG: pitrilysin family protein [Pseudomonadota bacterium]
MTAITSSRIDAAARRMLALSAGLLVALVGTGAGAAIEITERTSPGGILFWHVEEPAIPMVAFEVRFDGGAALDSVTRPGVARMVTALLDEGAGERDALAFAVEKERRSARFGFSTGRDGASVSARMLVDELAPSAALLAEALTAPRFDGEALERERRRRLSSIRQDATDPDSLARNAWYARAFPDHPYGQPAKGTVASVEAITVDDIRAMHGRLMTLDRAKVAVVGAIDADGAGALVDSILGGLPAVAPEGAAPAAPVDPAPPSGMEIIDLAVPQSVAILGHAGIARDDPDYIAAYVMNHVLGGGGFSSRLMTEVREKRGLAYGTYSYLSDLTDAPLVLASVSTANERVAESLEVIRAEWTRMAENGVSAEELDKAKRYLTGAFPLRFDTNSKIAGFLVAAQVAELGIDYVDIRNGLIEAVSVEDIRRVARRLLQPEALSVTVVGQPAGL